jgi:hypothetical protein
MNERIPGVNNNRVVQGLWIGSTLSVMENLSIKSFLDNPYLIGVSEDTYAVHLWNSMWVFGNQDKDATYSPGCIYEQLKARYL